MSEHWKIISEYSRRQAIKDMVLIDVSQTAKEAGFKCSVAVTAALWHDITHGPSKNQSDINGRLWDVLFMLYLQIKKNGNRQRIDYDLIMPVPGVTGKDNLYRLYSLAGPGDEGELVITILKPNED